jgi:glutamine amidotransferase
VKLTLIDYKAGNVASVIKALEHLDAEVLVTDDANQIAAAEALVLPGVGHFSATRALEPLRKVIAQRIADGVPFLGICVGMQWLYEGSTEAPEVAGLGLLRGTVDRFPASVKSPHVGWNTIAGAPTVRASEQLGPRILKGISDDSYVYYTHSYRCPVTEETAAITEYGGAFPAVVERDHVFGAQFHPEKSSETGLQLLRNFLKIAARNETAKPEQGLGQTGLKPAISY